MHKMHGCIILKLVSKSGGRLEEESQLYACSLLPRAHCSELVLQASSSIGCRRDWHIRCRLGGHLTRCCCGAAACLPSPPCCFGERKGLAWVEARAAFHLLTLQAVPSTCWGLSSVCAWSPPWRLKSVFTFSPSVLLFSLGVYWIVLSLKLALHLSWFWEGFHRIHPEWWFTNAYFPETLLVPLFSHPLESGYLKDYWANS